MAGRFKVESVFEATDKITAPISKMQRRVTRFTASMKRGLKSVNVTMRSTTAMLKRGAVAAGVAIAGMALVARDIIRTAADFERSIGSAAAKFPEQIRRGTAAFNELKEAAREVGRTTEFTAAQAAAGLSFLAKAGWSATFSMKSLASMIDFATASETDFATAADIASDTLGAFGLNVDDAAQRSKNLNRVMDVMSMTANSSNTNVEELFEAIKKSGPVAAAAGISLETYAATMGTLASNSIKASEAGTSAKNIMLSLAGVGFKAATTFKKLGIRLVDTNGELRDQFDVLDDLRKSYSKMTKQQQLANTEAIFGKRALASISILLGKAGESARSYRDRLEQAGGSTKRIASFIRDDLKGSIDGMTSAIESVKLTIFSMNEGPLKDTIDNMTKWIRLNEQLIATKVTEFIDKMVDGFRYIIDNKEELISTFAQIANSVVVLAEAITAVSKFSSKFSPLFTPLRDINGNKIDLGGASIENGQLVSPQERAARIIEERNTTNRSEILLTATPGTSAAVVGGGGLGDGLQLAQSGAF